MAQTAEVLGSRGTFEYNAGQRQWLIAMVPHVMILLAFIIWPHSVSLSQCVSLALIKEPVYSSGRLQYSSPKLTVAVSRTHTHQTLESEGSLEKVTEKWHNGFTASLLLSGTWEGSAGEVVSTRMHCECNGGTMKTSNTETDGVC